MTCPHEQLRGRCYHPSLAPWPGNCLDDDTCPGGLGPWGAWRAIVDDVLWLATRQVYLVEGGQDLGADMIGYFIYESLAAVGWSP